MSEGMFFEGFEPWREGEPEIELRTPNGIMDLHNYGCFKGFEYRLPETLSLDFEVDDSWGGRREGDAEKRVRVRFDRVSDLRAGIEERIQVLESDTLDWFTHVTDPERPGRSQVEVSMLDGFTLRFRAGSVTLDERASR